MKFISRGMLSASELNLPQAHQEIAVYAERVQRMFGMVADLLHEKEGSEAYLKLYNRIEKYEQICDPYGIGNCRILELGCRRSVEL